MNAKEWERRVDPHFGYLRTEFGCEIIDWSDKDWWETSVTYQNSTTAIKIACSEEFDGLETDIIRLVDGARPPSVVFISETPKLHKVGLGNLLMIRAPELCSELKEQKGQEFQIRAGAPILDIGTDFERRLVRGASPYYLAELRLADKMGAEILSIPSRVVDLLVK